MTHVRTALEELRDRHLELALTFELYAFTTDDGAEVPLLLDKREEAFTGAVYFQELINDGATEVPTR